MMNPSPLSAQLTLSGEIVQDLRQWLTARSMTGKRDEGDEFLKKLLAQMAVEDHVVFALRSEKEANPEVVAELRSQFGKD
tara:strand:+ start:13304 stop:13543 length:240 start_codon:yes stop_codon:yes gene_type:complete